MGTTATTLPEELMGSTVSLERLRGWFPEWQWTAERHGFGYRYLGKQGDRAVTVQAFATLCGPLDDDYSTQWRVDDGKTSKDLASWSLENQ